MTVIPVKPIPVKPAPPNIRLRTCSRCGREFLGHRANVCVVCRKPINQNRRPCCDNPTLSFREKQVMALVAEAKLNKEIAGLLHLTEGTIKEYMNRLFHKLGITNRTELAVWYLYHPEAEPGVPHRANDQGLEQVLV